MKIDEKFSKCSWLVRIVISEFLRYLRSSYFMKKGLCENAIKMSKFNLL